MILYHPKLSTELAMYGIDLPLRDDRSDQVFTILKKEFPTLSEFSLSDLPKISRTDLERAHEKGFLNRWFDDSGGFLEETLITYDCPGLIDVEEARPLSELRDSHLRQVSATYATLLESLKNPSQFCFYLGGGMHHGRYSYGSGFCPLNDIVVSIKKAQSEAGIGRVLVVDTDAHHGDGTAEITKNDSTIDTFSIHMATGWPLNDDLPFAPSTLDIGIGEGEEKNYLKELERGLKNFEGQDYDAVFVVAGADPYEKDELPSTQKLNLSKEQMLARDLIVYKWCQDQKLPQAWLMAGGYGKEAPHIYAQFILKVLHLMR